MESSKRRVGRPKSEPRNGPLVLDEGRSRVKIELELSAATARELAEYAAWVELSSSLTTADATFTTVEFALCDLYRRDRVWRERQRTSGRAKPISASPPVNGRPPSPTPSSLPPSGPRDPRPAS